MSDEPLRHRRFFLAIGLCALATIPFPFVGRELVLVAGLPLWLWWSFLATAMLSLVTTWGILNLWTGDDEDDDDGVSDKDDGDDDDGSDDR